MRTNTLIPFLFPLAVHAADLRLSGKVFDASGAPLFGVGVDLRRAKVGTATAPDGSWELTGSVQSGVATVGDPDTLEYTWNGASAGKVPVPTWEQTAIAQVVRDAGGSDEPDVAVAAACSDPTTSPSDRQQGLYARQSVSHLGNLVLRRSANELSQHQLAIVRGKLAETFRLPRFDDNPLPPQITSRFDHRLRKLEERSDEEITSLVDRTLVPPLMEVLGRKGLDRALDLRTDGQKSSAVSVGMKTDDITTDQLRKVMNASWIYIPVVDDVFRTEDGDLLTTEVAMTLMWYHVVCDSSTKRLQARLEQTIVATGRMVASKSKRSDAADFTLKSAAESCVKSLLVKTKQMEAFSVSGQVWEAGKLAATLDVGRREGVRMNDQYLLIENVEGADKQTSLKEVGWVRTYRVLGGDSVSRTRARIVSGEPYRGLSLREAPISNLSLEIGFLHEPVRIHEKERCETYDVLDWYGNKVGTTQQCVDLDKAPSHGSLKGLQLGAQYAIPWWYGLSAGLGMNLLGGEEFVMDLKTSVRQSIPIYRRLSLYVEPGAAIRIMPTGDPRNPNDTTWLPPAVVQSGILWGAEYALAPNVNLRVHFGSSDINGFDYSKGGVKTEMANDGAVFGISLQWSLSGVAVDPMDALAGGAFLPGGPKNVGGGSQGNVGSGGGSSLEGTSGSSAPRMYQQTKWRLESERKQLESQLKQAERESGRGSANYQSSNSMKIQGLYSRISQIDQKLIDLEYKKKRGEIQ